MDAGSLSDVRENQDCKLVNTPSSSYGDLNKLSKHDSYLQNDTRKKLKSINELQNLVKTMMSKNKDLSQIAQDDLDRIPPNVDSCPTENSSQYILLTTLKDIVTSCTHSMNVLQNFIIHYLPYSTKCSTNTDFQERAEIGRNYDIDGYGLIKVPIQEVVHALVETLPTFFTEDSQLVEELKVLARKVSRAENSCDICACELKTVWIIIQKMFLSLSLGRNKPEIEYSIDELVSCLLSTNFTCESESDTRPLNDYDSFLSESISSIYLLPFVEDGCSVRRNCDDVKSSEDLDSSENGANLQHTSMNFQRQYLKITHIESPYTSDEFYDEKESCKTASNGKYIDKNDRICLDLSSKGNDCASLAVEDGKCNDSNEERSDKLFECSLEKFWRALDSFPIFKTSTKQQPEVQNRLPSNSSKGGVTESNGKSQQVQHISNKPSDNFPPNSKSGESSYPNSRTTSSSFTNPSSFEHDKDTSRKIRTDTLQVKLTNRGEGFGLILGIKYRSNRSSIVPIIHSIKPKSPAQRTGVLQVDDRIVAINHRNTLGLTPQELQALSKQSFSAEAIVLKVEFDVVEAEPRFGTFDVILDKMLKIGLVFEDMKRGFPMFVSGIVKGSGAHRCGQLFRGDKIKFFRCIRNEEFDPVSCHYSKEESVLITVQRDPPAGHCSKSGCAPPCYFNPGFSHVDSVPQRGKSSLVRNRTVHAVGGSQSLVLDQEVTLFRDPVFWDFGFLVGENPDTGRAYVTDVRPEGPASESGAVKKFDRIVQVNGILVDRNIENSVLALLSQANHKVDLLLRRLYREDSATV